MSAGSFRGSYGKGAEREEQSQNCHRPPFPTPGPAHLQVNLIYLWSLRGGDGVAQAWSSHCSGQKQFSAQGSMSGGTASPTISVLKGPSPTDPRSLEQEELAVGKDCVSSVYFQ